jgi:hypothetical protein
MRKRDIIKMMYGSTMFGKLWEWIMGIIAWIMSKFSRKSSVESEPAEVEQAAVADSAAPEQEQAPTPNPSE